MSLPYEPYVLTKKHAAWLFHCGVRGAVLAPLTLAGGPVLVKAGLYTAGTVGGTVVCFVHQAKFALSMWFCLSAGFAAVAACSPNRRFLTWGGPLGIGLGVVFVSSWG